MTRKSLTVLFLFLVVATTILVLYYRPAHLFRDEYQYWGYKFEPGEAKGNIEFLSFKGDTEILEMTKIMEVAQPIAETVITDKVLMFQSLFEKQRIGYRGQHTEFIECPDRFKPRYFEKQLENGRLRYFVGFASARFAFGACSDEDVTYKAINAYLYCENLQTMFDIDYFGPIESGDSDTSFVDKISCAR